MVSSSTTLPKRLTTSAAPSKLLPRLRASIVNASDVAPDKQPLHLKHTFASSQRASSAARPKPPTRSSADPSISARFAVAFARHTERMQARQKALEAQQPRPKPSSSSQSRQLPLRSSRPAQRADNSAVEQIAERLGRTAVSSSAPRPRPAPLFLNRRQKTTSAPARPALRSCLAKRNVVSSQPCQALRPSKRVRFANEGFVVAKVRYFVESLSIAYSRDLKWSECQPLGPQHDAYYDDKTRHQCEVIHDKVQPIPRAPLPRTGRLYDPCCYRVAARGGFAMPHRYEDKRPVMPRPRCLAHG